MKKSLKHKIRCDSCFSQLEKLWVVCLYCGQKEKQQVYV